MHGMCYLTYAEFSLLLIADFRNHFEFDSFVTFCLSADSIRFLIISAFNKSAKVYNELL
jgi:hypothetical protein